MKRNSFNYLHNACNVCQDISFEVGKKLLRLQKKLDNLSITYKDSQGVASEADFTSEQFIIKQLKKFDKDIDILSEENFFNKFGNKSIFDHFKSKEWLWVVDPLDGTHNFLGNLDYYCISISLLYHLQPILGVIYRPTTGELFYAIKDYGAKHRNLLLTKKTSVMLIKKIYRKLGDSLVLTGFTSERGKSYDNDIKLYKKIAPHVRAVRIMGSAALDMCYVAKGLFDVFWERGLAPWDTSAATIICREAGFLVSNYTGKSFSPFDNNILVSSPNVYKKLIKIF